MNDVLFFLKTYWRELLEILVLILAFIFTLVKKRPVLNSVDSIKEDVLELLPVLINQVERPGDGSSKKESVVSLVLTYVKRKYKLTDVDFLLDFISDSIENILKTPQRKE